ncbi:hypothetical protein [Streptomyces fulvorobeus]|uniref:Uncharacterized protein n=1 Tax=Streptomyces fulvorobeus TaxID=284028 RepID=A0A7J0CCU3_9ACTN|nr:hypothetical protein [Streptomyces fulvorobeus]NYE43742.1 hypothetical protein [Streptomyces fulvorobeus]GFN00229.1 hypothetical protein Sfulv_50390 [Streptomyces fulvorobeus]
MAGSPMVAYQPWPTANGLDALPGSPNLDQVRDRLQAFEDRYNATAQPYQWKFTTSDLDDLLARLDRHQPGRHEEFSTAPAT